MKHDHASIGDPESEALPELPPREQAVLGLLGDFIGFHLRLAQDASFRAFAKHAGLRDLKPGRFAAMMVIHNNPGISQVALSRAIARDKSSVTPLIQDLERHDLVKRVQSKTDRRSVTLTLTPRRRDDAPPPARPRRRSRPQARRHRRRRKARADPPVEEDRRRSLVSAGRRRFLFDVHGQHGDARGADRGGRLAMSSPISAATTRPSSRRSPRRAPPGERSRRRHLPERDGGAQRRARLRAGQRPARRP